MMKLYKLSSILFLSILSLWVLMPPLSAKHHHHSYHSTSFGLNINVNQPRVYEPVVVAPAPAYVTQTTYVQPYAPVAPVVEERVYYPYYQPVVVARPCQPVYVQPQFSFYSSWGFGR